MSINVHLLRKVLEHITEHPNEWDQDNWGVKTACGTAHCVAGHTVAMTGHELMWFRQGSELHLGGVNGVAGYCSVHAAARDELGLDDDEAYLLFHPDNSLDVLWGYAEDLTNGEITKPDLESESAS